MKLKELLHGLDVLELHADEALDITGVQYDSRQVTPGALFVAISGFQTDGHKYIPKAMENGAVCVVCEKKPETDIPYVLVSNARSALAALGANWFGHPADAMCVVGITGTNGKTTSTYLLKHVLEKTLGAKVGLIGTIQNMIGDEILHTERTTPESFELQKLFADMRDAGCTHVIMEVSSHALVLHRADQIRFSAAVFTNLTEDHLDFHKTMDAYCDAKAMLFRRCETGAVNVDDAYAKRIMEQADCRLLTYSAQGNPASLMAEHVELFSDRVEFDAVYQNKRASVTLGIPGIFSVYNALGVIAAALALNIPLQKIADALRTAQSVKGRVEVVPDLGGFADHDAGSVVNDQPTANGRAGMDLDSRPHLRPLRDRTGDEKAAPQVKPVRDPVVDGRVQAVIQQHDLNGRPCGRVIFLICPDILQ